jgi:hypothetical protein
MNDVVIIASVASRYSRLIRSTDWYAESDAMELDEAQDVIQEDLKHLGAYLKKCRYLATINHNLAAPLATPKIEANANLIEKRINDVEQFAELLQSGSDLFHPVDSECGELMLKIARKEIELRHGLMETVQDLPSMVKLHTTAKQAGRLQTKIRIEDDDFKIDWNLENYLGPEALIVNQIEKAYPGAIIDDIRGVTSIFGFIIAYTDTEALTEWIADLRK